VGGALLGLLNGLRKRWEMSGFKNIVAANSYLFKGRIQQGRWVGKYLYKSIVLFIARFSGPRVGRTRSEALDIRASACKAERAGR